LVHRKRVQLTISKAQEKDIPELCKLLHFLFTQESEFTPSLENQSRGLSKVIANDSVGLVFVCKEDGHIVGMVILLFTVSTALGEEVALLEDMVVAPTHRGRMIGDQLISHAINCAVERGCKRITLLTDADNLDAQRFYKRKGFTQSSMIAMRVNFK